ncbi:MBL fold metallo-hydrolase [Alteromonas sp. ASW11-36]|uniref:MBL fold metallo-hydrolase n=1 Tax=Alteromonas arenosi TaxID=3055817 RepID=A0ABT7SUS4_9ALTE|nr:MBL fold metallo-hydrolase [Alteromonas sp. ASW11-36]MDM7859307.1 MBL fold metallo-hydrolase [Alteromonas sp. ASW11-36]
MISIHAFFHQASSTISYVVYEQASKQAMIIDSALDYSAHTGKLWTEFADQQIAFIANNNLHVEWILETHAHADHISAAYYLKSKLGGRIGAGAGVVEVQKTFIEFFDLDCANITRESQPFDHLFVDNETFSLGNSEVSVIATPGHTNDSVTYLIEGNAFVGDTLFMPDGGTARCDFPGGSAEVLFASIERLHRLPEQTVLWMCHDYQPEGRELKYNCTVAQSKADNIHVGRGNSRDDFVKLRESRDENLDIPRLLYPSVQLNIAAGKLPPKAANGKRFIKQPIAFI